MSWKNEETNKTKRGKVASVSWVLRLYMNYSQEKSKSKTRVMLGIKFYMKVDILSMVLVL